MQDHEQQALRRFLAQAAHAEQVSIARLQPLSGGAVQENWLLDLELVGGAHAGRLECVLRCDSASAGVAVSLSRAHEFALFQLAFGAGVTVPEPLWLCDDDTVLGRPFFIMRRVRGSAAGHVLVRDLRLGGDRVQLTRRLGSELARIHALRAPQASLPFLPWYEEAPALRSVRLHRAFLDRHGSAHPALEWGLRWLERHAPARATLTLCHRDFRTGNYMVDENGLTGVLDWEFAGWSDPLEDIGWFCARCWRFGQNALEAGGIGTRADFYSGYESVSGTRIDAQAVKYWEVMAHMTWAIIALQQAQRFVSGAENSLLLALTGHIVPELEWEILNLTEAD